MNITRPHWWLVIVGSGDWPRSISPYCITGLLASLGYFELKHLTDVIFYVENAEILTWHTNVFHMCSVNRKRPLWSLCILIVKPLHEPMLTYWNNRNKFLLNYLVVAPTCHHGNQLTLVLVMLTNFRSAIWCLELTHIHLSLEDVVLILKG